MSETKKPRLSSIRISKEARKSHVRCRCISGHAFYAEIYTALDMRENADAVDALVSVGLQQVRCAECGVGCSVAEPVTIHDPAKKRFSLFIPDMLSHRELELRALLLEKLITAGADDFPPYFSDFQTLVGRTALGLWLTSSKGATRTASSGAPAEAGPSSDKAPDGENPLVSNEEPPPIHEAFADLDDGESYMPSYPPEPEADEAEDDWLDDKTFGSGVHLKPPPSEPPPLTGRQAIVDVEDNRIVLIQRSKNEIIEAFDPARSELWFQLHLLDGFPLVVLALVAEPRDEASPFLLWFVDMTRQAKRSAVLQLQKEYLAEVRLYTPDLKEAMRFEVGGQRESNVALAMDRIHEMLSRPIPNGAFEKACASFRDVKDPLGRNLGPYGFDDMSAAEDFEAAFKNLTSLRSCLAPERFEQLVLIRSFPIPRLDELVSRAIEDAILFGVHLQDDLKDRAVALGLATDRKEIVSKTMSTFDKLLRSGKGPPEEIAASNWQNVLKDCDVEGIEPDFGAWERAEELLDRLGLLNPGDSSVVKKA
jgi:hypothetical protein